MRPSPPGSTASRPCPPTTATPSGPLSTLWRRGTRPCSSAHDTGYLPGRGVGTDLAARKDLRLGLAEPGLHHGFDENRQNHMGFSVNVQVRDRLVDMGLADGETLFVCNHFSHNGGGSYEELSAQAQAQGMLASYDGLTLEF